MKHYIALGGIGCRTLKAFSTHTKTAQPNCYYIDTDLCLPSLLEPGDRAHIVKNLSAGTATFRQIGKNAVRHELFTNKMGSFFEPIFRDDDAQLFIVTSSFGGFGSASAAEFAEYLQAMLWDRNKASAVPQCTIIAFSEAHCKSAGFPKPLTDAFSLNTMEMVTELSSRNALVPSAAALFSESPIFNPSCSFYLIDTSRMAQQDFWQVLDCPEETLRALDIRKQYMDLMKPRRSHAQVFISYSFLDQKIADLLANALEERGIGCWIATRSIREGSYAAQIIQGIRTSDIFVVLLSRHSIASEQVKNEIDRAFARLKDGLKIVPFLMDDTELDDECSYYLCRQEFFFGKLPPIEQRIADLAEKIQGMVE